MNFLIRSSRTNSHKTKFHIFHDFQKNLQKKSEKRPKKHENGRFGSGFFARESENDPPPSSNQWLLQNDSVWLGIQQSVIFNAAYWAVSN